MWRARLSGQKRYTRLRIDTDFHITTACIVCCELKYYSSSAGQRYTRSPGSSSIRAYVRTAVVIVKYCCCCCCVRKIWWLLIYSVFVQQDERTGAVWMLYGTI